MAYHCQLTLSFDHAQRDMACGVERICNGSRIIVNVGGTAAIDRKSWRSESGGCVKRIIDIVKVGDDD